MKRTPDIEPGLIPIFRLFVGVMFVLLSLGLGGYVRREPPDYFGVLMWGFLAVMLPPLFWQRLRRWLGDRWLPLLLWSVSLYPIAADAVANAALIRRGITDPVLLETTRLYFWLLIPLLLISAQYGWRTLMLFCVGTALLPVLLALPFADQLDFSGYLGAAFVRLTLYTVAGYIVMRITSAARQQRLELTQKNQQIAQYAATLEQLAVARERNRLARELHDTLAHTLSAVNIQLKALDVLLESDTTAARKTLLDAQELTRSGLSEARRSLQALRARPIDELGLGLALGELARSAAERAGLTLTLDVPPQIDGLSPDREQQIYRITEEALNNVVRHANARTLHVSWKNGTLVIRDDGVGFSANGQADGHFGVTGMKERAGLMDAALKIDSAPGSGTTITLEVGS